MDDVSMFGTSLPSSSFYGLRTSRPHLLRSDGASYPCRLDQSGLAAEEENYGSTILFYPRDGGAPHIFQMGERTGETVRLPMGTYDAIIFNRSFNDFSNIAFRGDSYETLEAYARKVETRVDEVTRVETRTIISSPDELAVATLEGFIVTEDMLGNYSQTTYGRTAASRTVEEETDEFIPFALSRKS